MGVKRMFYTQLASGKELPSYFSAEHFVKVIIKADLPIPQTGILLENAEVISILISILLPL